MVKKTTTPDPEETPDTTVENHCGVVKQPLSHGCHGCHCHCNCCHGHVYPVYPWYQYTYTYHHPIWTTNVGSTSVTSGGSSGITFYG